MTRLIASTCGLAAEVVAFDSSGLNGLTVLLGTGVIVSACLWWSECGQFVDRIIEPDS